jgi:hypothetical protein
MNPIFIVLCALLSLAVPPAAAQVEPPWRPHILVVDSLDDVKPWIDKRGANMPRLRDIPAGMKVHFPVAVTNIPALAGSNGLHFEADIEFLGPRGEVLWSRKGCCRKLVRDTPQGHAVALEPAASVQFEPNDTAGIYSVRAVVNDGQRTATVVESIRFGETTREPPGGIRLQMDVPKKNPGVDRDVRNCLDLPTPAEVIKCTERGKR